MMDTSSEDRPASRPEKSERRLAGSYDAAEQDRSKRHRRRASRARERRLRVTRIWLVFGLTVVTGIGGLTWRDLVRKHFEASEPLKYIGIQYELQRMEILRYAPFHERRERQLSKELDRAMGELNSQDLAARVVALQQVRAILAPRKALALQRIKRDYPQMKESFEINLEDSDVAIKELRTLYARTLKTYNGAAGSAPAMLVRPIFGLPDKLPPLKS
jgi:hypothetical protein